MHQSVPGEPFTFKQFPNLPLELRRLVIILSIKPRIVRVRWNKHIQLCTSPDNPAILQVSREVRFHALEVLRSSFDTSLKSRGTIWFAPAIDTLSIDWKSFADGQGTPGIITGEFPIPKEADNIISLKIHCDELRMCMMESMLHSKSYLKNLQTLHVFGCQERHPKPVPPSLLKELRNLAAPGDITWPELICDLNLNGNFCHTHFWFPEWTSSRCFHEKEWAVAFYGAHLFTDRRPRSRTATRRRSLQLQA